MMLQSRQICLPPASKLECFTSLTSHHQLLLLYRYYPTPTLLVPHPTVYRLNKIDAFAYSTCEEACYHQRLVQSMRPRGNHCHMHSRGKPSRAQIIQNTCNSQALLCALRSPPKCRSYDPFRKPPKCCGLTRAPCPSTKNVSSQQEGSSTDMQALRVCPAQGTWARQVSAGGLPVEHVGAQVVQVVSD